MPNWCNTRIAFYAIEDNTESLYQVRSIYEMLEKLNSMPPRIKTDFGVFWEGNVCDYYGLNPYESDCRGTVYDYEWCGDSLVVYQEDAWSPNATFWEDIISKNYPLVGMVYTAEETGNGLYINTDTTGKYFPERYSIDFYYDGDAPVVPYDLECTEYFDSEQEVLDSWNDRTKHEFSSIAELTEFLATQEKLGLYVYVNEYETE
jgi:hypothetical protein